MDRAAVTSWLKRNYAELFAGIRPLGSLQDRQKAEQRLQSALVAEIETTRGAVKAAVKAEREKSAEALSENKKASAAAPNADNAHLERTRVLGILNLPKANPAGLTFSGEGQFDDLLSAWARDPNITLSEAARRYSDISRAYDAAAREHGLEALRRDEEQLDAPGPGGEWQQGADTAASIKSACDYVARLGILSGQPPAPSPAAQSLSNMLEEAQTRIAAGERL